MAKRTWEFRHTVLAGKEKRMSEKITQKVTSTEIKLALREWKPKDYFLTEVKNGSTYFPPAQGLLIFDGIGIRKSYTQPCITIYEIKVSRSDFLQDPKWKLYLQYCNEFYFVVPRGLIDKSELPEDVGLIYYNPETKKLLTRQKSKYRECENPYEVYQYIIYSRLAENPHPFYEKRADYARDYLADKADKKYLGNVLGSKMACDMSEMAIRLEKLRVNEDKINFYDDVVKLLKERGYYSWRCSLEEVLKELEKRLTHGCNPDDLEDIKRDASHILRIVERMEAEGKNESNPEISGE